MAPTTPPKPKFEMETCETHSPYLRSGGGRLGGHGCGHGGFVDGRLPEQNHTVAMRG